MNRRYLNRWYSSEHEYKDGVVYFNNQLYSLSFEDNNYSGVSRCIMPLDNFFADLCLPVLAVPYPLRLDIAPGEFLKLLREDDRLFRALQSSRLLDFVFGLRSCGILAYPSSLIIQDIVKHFPPTSPHLAQPWKQWHSFIGRRLLQLRFLQRAFAVPSDAAHVPAAITLSLNDGGDKYYLRVLCPEFVIIDHAEDSAKWHLISLDGVDNIIISPYGLEIPGTQPIRIRLLDFNHSSIERRCICSF